jgi:hypothetical protein
MTIETKYSIGDKVWAIARGSVKCREYGQRRDKGETVRRWGCSEHIAIRGIYISSSGLNYLTDISFNLPEENIFPSRELAQAECDRRNAEGK